MSRDYIIIREEKIIHDRHKFNYRILSPGYAGICGVSGIYTCKRCNHETPFPFDAGKCTEYKLTKLYKPIYEWDNRPVLTVEQQLKAIESTKKQMLGFLKMNTQHKIPSHIIQGYTSISANAYSELLDSGRIETYKITGEYYDMIRIKK